MSQLPDGDRTLTAIGARLAAISSESRTADEATGHRLALEATQLRARHKELAGQVLEAERDLIRNAQVIGTTIAKAFIDDTVWDWDADVIIVDEASMAGLPYVLALAIKNPTTLSFFGDFRQLPPIAISTAEVVNNWFARDVFDFALVRELIERGEPDQRTSILRVQFRMGESICQVVNELAYDNMLRTHPVARDRAIRLCDAEPEPGAELVIVDTSALGCACDMSKAPDSFSRINWYSAAISATVAQRLASQFDSDVGVLSPYNLQAQALAHMTAGVSYVDAATVHRFQGGERAGIVVDLTDDHPRAGPSNLSGKDTEISMRLLNVAASRAIGKLVIVGNLSFVDSHHGRASGTLRLLEAAQNAGATTIDAAQLLDDWATGTHVGDSGPRWFPSVTTAIDYVAGNRGALSHTRIDCNLPSDATDPSVIDSLTALAAAHTDPTVVRGHPRLIGNLDPTLFDARLQTVGASPWIRIGSRMILGQENFVGTTVVVDSTYLRAIIQRHFLSSE